jgi:hypothetical protein
VAGRILGSGTGDGKVEKGTGKVDRSRGFVMDIGKDIGTDKRIKVIVG